MSTKQVAINKLKQKAGSLRAQSILHFLGVPRQKIYTTILDKSGKPQKDSTVSALWQRRGEKPKKFWDKDRYALEDLLREARNLYIQQVKMAHPDRKPKTPEEQSKATEEVIILNEAWEFLENLFRKKGFKLD